MSLDPSSQKRHWQPPQGQGDGTPLNRMMVPDSYGAVWCHLDESRYEADVAAARLLGIPEAGPLDDSHIVALLREVAPGPEDQTRYYTFFSPSGSISRARRLSSPPGMVVILVDELRTITGRVFQLKASEREYRELFENAAHGLYKSTFDGKPLHMNPALIKLHGFASEADLLAAGDTLNGDIYIQPRRRAEFFEELHRTGRVSNFESEIVRLATGDRIWISEEAWLVRDAAGEPRYYAGTVVDITSRMRYMESLREAAETDVLTGLSNRFAFNGALERTVASAGCARVTVLLIDIDRFKDVNDIYGHDRGDAVLCVCADRLKALLPCGTTLARLGGDEFAILTCAVGSDAEALALANDIVRAFEQPIDVNGTGHLVGASVGIARFPDQAGTAQELMRNADLALYSVKDGGRGHARLYDAELDRMKQDRHRLELELRLGLARGEFELHYQPVVDAATSLTVGLEALLRWNNPQRGRVPPAVFVPVAEDAGLMIELGGWVIGEACRHAAALPPHIRLAVNVSALQFRSFDLPRVLSDALSAHGVDPSRLEVEVTETVVLKNEAATFAVLAQLKALGIRIALDDFGTGYSSLSYLQRFTFDKVKIDRAFVRSIKTDAVNRAVTRAVLSIGRDLGIEVVAEGIETEAELNTLRDEGCTLMQGYFYGPPAPLEEAATRIALETLRQPTAPGVPELTPVRWASSSR